jgi:hypothetical protein
VKLVWLLENFETEKYNLVSKVREFDIGGWTCGTAACAAGAAMLHPWFRERGFTSDDNDSPRYAYGKTDRQKIAWEESFFGLEIDESGLFYGDTYDAEEVTPQMVADRMKEVLKKYADE